MKALLGSKEDIDVLVRELVAGDETALAAYEARKKELGEEAVTALMRRLVLQITDFFWLEQLENMDYLRRSVSLRAYGQRDPLLEYRREGLMRFQQMEENIAQAFREALPRVQLADEEKIKAEEAKTRRAVLAASEGGDGSTAQGPIVKSDAPGRNDMVTIRNGEKTLTMKYKKAEPYIQEGWELV
jgi:preprotein translocase subunit SecA